MKDYFKTFKELVEGVPGLVIMIIVAVLPLFLNWPNFNSTFSAIGIIIMISTISAIAIWLTIKKNYLLAATLLLFSFGYTDGVSRFVNLFLTFNFDDFPTAFALLLGFAWLISVIITYLVFGEHPVYKPFRFKNELWLLIAFGYFYVSVFFSATLFIVLLALGLLVFSNRTLSYAFVGAHLFRSIMVGFQSLKTYIEFDLLSQIEFRFYFLQAVGVTILVFAVMQVIKGYKTDILFDDNSAIETKN